MQLLVWVRRAVLSAAGSGRRLAQTVLGWPRRSASVVHAVAM
ncbi:hypothetical protein E2C01_101861 [Portunus trituberculatus]|uniref:Uncharacterized protein n=1 Tax=Portunus trituberculatus TaxID=210409 RepID=A0A5B7KL30_PORTR|nr:hypothetical protein [Portunus trituberculatus]